MYKVIIVDDENIIVEGLQRVVDWTPAASFWTWAARRGKT